MKQKDKKSMEKGFVVKFAQEIDAVNNARYRAIVTHTIIELLVDVLVECKCKHGKDICEQMQYTHAIKLVILNEANIISDNEFAMLNAMRSIRNKAAHAGKFILTPKLTKPFGAMNSPDNNCDFSDPNCFLELCVALVFEFWNAHGSLFTRYFEPDFGKRKTP